MRFLRKINTPEQASGSPPSARIKFTLGEYNIFRRKHRGTVLNVSHGVCDPAQDTGSSKQKRIFCFIKTRISCKKNCVNG